MSKFTEIKDYHSLMNLHDTQIAIKRVKDYFQRSLADELNLLRVSAPTFVSSESGLNDNLTGIERPVSFDIKDGGAIGEVVHSLAKWKRSALKRYGFEAGEGIYTDMVAIRRDEELDNIHSVYVDQWDWEKIIDKKDRTQDCLKDIVKKIYKSIKSTENYITAKYDYIKQILPDDIYFITADDLLKKYPDKTPKEREYAICKEKKAVFISQVGKILSDGTKHDLRSPDYDDWELNGDILVYYPVLDIALELSSMGIRVDEESLKKQLIEANCIEREKYPYHQAILNKELPYTIGGGIGQSRLCLFFLRKAHIGEVHSSLWSKEIYEKAQDCGIILL